ncbi:MAG: CBS domain-containing protein [Planctomycetota bacterium]|nr:MAG: CBS domain-containing protein [Planctomycetota bacterium]
MYEIEGRLKKTIISPATTIQDAVPVLNDAGLGVLLICDGDRKLLALMTDGDIRRAIINRVSFDKPCIDIANKKLLFAKKGLSEMQALHLMDTGKSFPVNHLPVVDEENRVIDLILRKDLISEESLNLRAMIMAGGKGTRLRPLTEDMPKPMLPVGVSPLLEKTVENLRHSGIQQINIATHYLKEKIKEHFGDGEEFGVSIQYVEETKPLGTAGALGLIDSSTEPILVINGDIVTNVDFSAMLGFHRKHNADMTVATRGYDFKMPFGVVDTDGMKISSVREKPEIHHFILAGIYLLNPAVCSYVPAGEPHDMPDLIQRLVNDGKNVINFPIYEYWLDIGGFEDYRRAQDDFNDG